MDIKCECGSEHVGSSGHSSWCPKSGNKNQLNHDKAVITGNYQIFSDGMGFKMTFIESGEFILPDIKNSPVGTTYVIKNVSKDKKTKIPVKTFKDNNIFLGDLYVKNYELKQHECMTIIRYENDFSWFLY